MIFDKAVMFADNLDVAGSPDDVDLEDVGMGPGQPMVINVAVESGVTGVTGISLQDSADGSSFDALFTWTGDLAGRPMKFYVPEDCRRYLRLNLAGTVAGGNWTAGITLEGSSSNR